MSRSDEVLWETARPIADVQAWAESTLIPAFRQYGFRIEQRTTDSILLVRRRSAWWLIFFSIIAFWLSPDEKGHISVSFSTASEGTSRMTVLGDLPAKVRRILLELPGCSEVFRRR